ncbi:hypothetical protein D3C80_1900400 [compost metagenome]
MRFEKLDTSKKIKIATTIAIVLIVAFAVTSFAQYQSMKLNFQNPLIPEKLIEMATLPYLKKGIILSIGLFITLLLKYMKRNFFAFCIALALIAYYILSDHYFGGWHTQLH